MRSINAATLVIVVCGFLVPPRNMSHAAESASQPATKPVSNTDPDVVQWRAHCDLEDGRRLITDGSLLLESKYLPKVPVPEKTVPAQGVQRLLQSETDKEFGLDDLQKKSGDGHYVAPSGMQLNRKYINLLRESPVKATLQFRAKGANDPVLILDGQKVVGVMMPMKT